jgi:hypothetical protein
MLKLKTAFFYPHLHPDDKMWIKRPKEITDSQISPVVEVNKSIYGLPRASQHYVLKNSFPLNFLS